MRERVERYRYKVERGERRKDREERLIGKGVNV